MDNPKICVIMATYCRKNGRSKEFLSQALKCLEAQTYGDFKLFLIGDHYDNNEEFEELCKSYTKDIFYTNNKETFRDYKFNDKTIYWKIGGGIAIKTGLEMAINENFDYYFHLDDDDVWKNNHIQIAIDHIKKYPEADFLLTKAQFRKGILPVRGIVSNIIEYNNYIITPADTVHASHVYNLKKLGSTILDILNNDYHRANQIHNKLLSEANIIPGDKTLVNNMADKQKNGQLKSLYIPILTVVKQTDYNLPI